MEEHENRPVGGKRLAPESRGGFWNNWGYLIVTVAVIVVLFKVIFQLSWVPSGSMETTIPEDTLLISWQLPYVMGDPVPERGNIVTFWSDELDKLLVKRVIGLPGDTVSFSGGYVYINGVATTSATITPTRTGTKVQIIVQNGAAAPYVTYLNLQKK